MAGSQLKQLKEALKNNGLVGQTNVKRKNKHAKTASETRRANDPSKNILSGIRDQFNQFDQRINRNKHDFTIVQGGKFVKAGSKQHNDSTKNRSNVERNLKLAYEANKKQKGRTGGVMDRRFGESDQSLTAEEKMLARFTKERQSASKKKNVFSLGSEDEYSDDEDDAGFTLTHSGKSLDFGEEEDEGLGGSKKYIDEDQLMPSEEQPARRKTKAEVMKEVIAKSKFYKHQRQQEFEKAQENIMDLDDEFGDVMGELNQSIAASASNKKPQFSTKTPEEIEYDRKMRELTYDRRSVPADRTKTDEELAKEHQDKLKKLEADRLSRMNGLDVEREGDVLGDDLDDDFWAGDEEENEADGFAINESDSGELEEGDEEENSESETDKPRAFGRTLKKATPSISMPTTTEELNETLSSLGDATKKINHIKKIVEVYKPNLAEGNKDKMNQFVSILFQHILFLSQQPHPNQTLTEVMVKMLKKLSETFNQSIVETVRQELNEIQQRVLDRAVMKRDLVCFVIVGYLFSTSDHYHLIVTPALIIMNEFISQRVLYHGNGNIDVAEIAQGLFLADVLLNYQFFAKRYIPEVMNFLERCLLVLIPEPAKIGSGEPLISTNHIYKQQRTNLSPQDKFAVYSNSNINMSLEDIFAGETHTPQYRFNLLIKVFYLIDKSVTLWKDQSSLLELIKPINHLLKHGLKYYASTLPQLVNLTSKLNKLSVNIVASRRPLTLQHHRALAIPTFAPKFEENFNPDKKSYDPNVERQEMSKMKHELKKEKKSLLKDMRKQTKFEAREQIKDKKSMYEDYHKKMSNIVNTINSSEGAEKNKYEKERKNRKH